MSQPSRPYQTAARYYHARPPYSSDLLPVLSAMLGWNGTGRLLDVGCGPGIVAFQLGDGFRVVIGLDPEPTMLEEATRLSASSGNPKTFQWVLGRAEDIPSLGLGSFQSVTLAQSFHWTTKAPVAEIIYDALDDDGTMLLIHHNTLAFAPGEPSTLSVTAPPPHPPIPHEVIDQVLVRWLGHGKPAQDPNREPYIDLLARTRFRGAERLILPGRRDLVRSIDQVIDNYLSTSFAAPELFGPELDKFRADLTEELKPHTHTGFFWEWPGDTAVLIARKRRSLS